MVWFRLLALLFLGASGKGGGHSGGYSGGGYYGGGGVVTSRAAFVSAGAFGAVVLLSAGSRGRYGTYNDPNDASMCMLLSEDEMRSSCVNLIGDETRCHDCMACETEDCMYGITNCDEYLASVFTECCVENCEEDNTIAVIIGFVVSSCICIGICGCLFMRMKAASVASQTPAYDQNYVAGSPPGPGAIYQQNPMMVQGTVVQGQVIGTGPPPANKVGA